MKNHIMKRWKDLSSRSNPENPAMAQMYFFAGAVAAVTKINEASMGSESEWERVTYEIYEECKAWAEKEEGIR